MARFGQGMIQALTQPSYMQGLYEAAKGVGEMPARRRLQGMLADMQPGSAEYYRVLAENEKDPVKAAALGQQATQLETSGLQADARANIATLQQKMEEVLRDPSKSQAQKDSDIDGLQTAVTNIARNARLDATQFSSLGATLRSNYNAEERND